jgi:hypothetical protein
LTVDPNSIAHRDIELETRCLGDDVFFDAVPSRNPKPGGLKSDDQTSRDGQHGGIISSVSGSHIHVRRPWRSRCLAVAQGGSAERAPADRSFPVRNSNAYELPFEGNSTVPYGASLWFSAYIRGIFLDAPERALAFDNPAW